MKSSLEKTAVRLVGALEDLVLQETVLLRAGFYREAVAVQVRATPLVARLRELGGELASLAAVVPRIAAVLERRRESISYLQAQRTSLDAERQRLRTARGRLQNVGQYARSLARRPSKRLNAAV